MDSAGTSARRRRGRRGFTLAEILISAVVLSVAVAALVAAFGYETTAIARGEETTVGTFLAEEIRDMAIPMTIEEALALDATTFDPAVLSTGEVQGDARFAQSVETVGVRAAELTAVVQDAQADAVRLTVTVLAHGVPVVTQVYYVFDTGDIPYAGDE